MAEADTLTPEPTSIQAPQASIDVAPVAPSGDQIAQQAQQFLHEQGSAVEPPAPEGQPAALAQPDFAALEARAEQLRAAPKPVAPTVADTPQIVPETPEPYPNLLNAPAPSPVTMNAPTAAEAVTQVPPAAEPEPIPPVVPEVVASVPVAEIVPAKPEAAAVIQPNLLPSKAPGFDNAPDAEPTIVSGELALHTLPAVAEVNQAVDQAKEMAHQELNVLRAKAEYVADGLQQKVVQEHTDATRTSLDIGDKIAQLDQLIANINPATGEQSIEALSGIIGLEGAELTNAAMKEFRAQLDRDPKSFYSYDMPDPDGETIWQYRVFKTKKSNTVLLEIHDAHDNVNGLYAIKTKKPAVRKGPIKTSWELLRKINEILPARR